MCAFCLFCKIPVAYGFLNSAKRSLKGFEATASRNKADMKTFLFHKKENEHIKDAFIYLFMSTNVNPKSEIIPASRFSPNSDKIQHPRQVKKTKALKFFLGLS